MAEPVAAIGALAGVGYVWGARGSARAGARRDRRAARLRRAGDPQRRGDVPRLRPPRRHGDMVQPDRPAVQPWPLVREPAELDLRAERAPTSDHDRLRLPVGGVHAARRRALGDRHRYRLDLPALPRLLRGGALARIYALVAPLLEWRWLRAFVAFIAAQSALLFGYAAWGGIKELTAAFLLGLGDALAAELLVATIRARAMCCRWPSRRGR
jgi:hypothetical protein